ncbi:MAG TPA: TPM domain-containing protein [Vicinamibacteria bacterium]|nr:TPM domain-containing protein [Vicinamibacteria bacterium]
MRLKSFLNQVDHDRIVAAIAAAEARSRGEIRVHASNRAVADAQKAATEQFERLGMAGTAERNGVLIYVAPLSRSFAIVGDSGIHERCGPDFWRDVAAAMEREFRAGKYTEGIVRGIERAGAALAENFPRGAGGADRNELPDSVSED